MCAGNTVNIANRISDENLKLRMEWKLIERWKVLSDIKSTGCVWIESSPCAKNAFQNIRFEDAKTYVNIHRCASLSREGSTRAEAEVRTTALEMIRLRQSPLEQNRTKTRENK